MKYLLCKLPKWAGGGHKRGKLTGLTKTAEEKITSKTFKCPRCDETWSRKVKAA